MCFIFFFFQAEDGIRDYKVTGVQTCALPILLHHVFGEVYGKRGAWGHAIGGMGAITQAMARAATARGEIGRASCRGRGEISVVAVSLKKKKRKIVTT